MTTTSSPRVLVPLEITDAMLISSTVAENDYPAHSLTTLYAAGDLCISAHKICIALIGKKAVVTMTIAAPGVVSWVAHGFAQDTPVVLTTTGGLPTGLTAGTTYYVKLVDANSFQLATAAGGAAITTTGTQSGTHTCGLASNYGKTPASNLTAWQALEATNRWKMFDAAVSSQTTATTSLTVVLQPGFFNDVALYGVMGGTVTITVKDQPGGSVIKSYTGSIDGPYLDEYDWCWGPPRTNPKVVLTDILPYPSAELTITVSASSGTVGIGMVAIGTYRSMILGDWGGTEYGARAEPVTCSAITVDDYGNTRIVRRRAATDMRISVVLPQADADYAVALLQSVLDIPVSIIATTAAGYARHNVFGLPSGSFSSESCAHVTADIYVKGMY